MALWDYLQGSTHIRHMKTLLAAITPLILIGCVFESPFETKAGIAVDPALLGRWEHVAENAKSEDERMLVMQHSENEYVVEYPSGSKAMFFRAFAVSLSGAEYIQVQLIGTAKVAVKPGDRKYHLLQVKADGDLLEIRTIRHELLGRDLTDTERMKAAFAAHKDDPGLFGDPMTFRRIRE